MILIQQVGDRSNTQSELIVMQELPNVVRRVLVVVGRRTLQNDPFPLAVRVNTWQIGRPFFGMPALVFYHLFLGGLRAELPTQVLRFTAIRFLRNGLLGFWHLLGGFLRLLLGATGSGVSNIWSTTRIRFCLLVRRFCLLMIRIAVTPRWFDVGVVTTILSTWLCALWSCHLGALSRG